MSHPNKCYPVAVAADFDKGRAMQAVQAALPLGNPEDLLSVPRSVIEAFVTYAQMKLSEASVYADAYMKKRIGREEFDDNIEPKLAEMLPLSRHLLDVLEDAGLIVLCNSSTDAALVNSSVMTIAAIEDSADLPKSFKRLIEAIGDQDAGVEF